MSLSQIFESRSIKVTLLIIYFAFFVLTLVYLQFDMSQLPTNDPHRIISDILFIPMLLIVLEQTIEVIKEKMLKWVFELLIFMVVMVFCLYMAFMLLFYIPEQNKVITVVKQNPTAEVTPDLVPTESSFPSPCKGIITTSGLQTLELENGTTITRQFNVGQEIGVLYSSMDYKRFWIHVDPSATVQGWIPANAFTFVTPCSPQTLDKKQ